MSSGIGPYQIGAITLVGLLAAFLIWLAATAD